MKGTPIHGLNRYQNYLNIGLEEIPKVPLYRT